jgi:hypothetical protein
MQNSESWKEFKNLTKSNIISLLTVVQWCWSRESRSIGWWETIRAATIQICHGSVRITIRIELSGLQDSSVSRPMPWCTPVPQSTVDRKNCDSPRNYSITKTAINMAPDLLGHEFPLDLQTYTAFHRTYDHQLHTCGRTMNNKRKLYHEFLLGPIRKFQGDAFNNVFNLPHPWIKINITRLSVPSLWKKINSLMKWAPQWEACVR